jgi:hypothetical protein
MDYVIMFSQGNDSKVLGRYDTLEDAISAGEQINKRITERGILSCIKGNVNDDGTIEGRSYFYKGWL